MQTSGFRAVCLLVSAFLSAPGLRAADTHPAQPPLPDFAPVAWLPSAGDALKHDDIPARGVQFAPGTSPSHTGDTVTVLVQETGSGKDRQWAVLLKANEIKAEEQKLRTQPFAMYTNTGRKVTFDASSLSGIAIRVVGPFSATRKSIRAGDVWSGALVNPQFLGMGLDRAAALFLRIDRVRQADPSLRNQAYSLSAGATPFPADLVARDSETLKPLAVTDEEYRAFVGFVPAMFAFFNIVSQTPGMKELLFEVVDIPWWALATHGGRLDDVNFGLTAPILPLSPEEWGLPAGTPVYTMGMVLNVYGKPVLHCRLALTRPRAPLFNCAGIIGLAAMRPDGKGPRVMIRVMASRPFDAAH